MAEHSEVDAATLDGFIAALDAQPEPFAALEVRNADKREIGIRIVPWEVPMVTRNGPEVIMRGAFEGTDPTKVVLRMDHEGPAAGRGIDYEDRPDGGYMTFKVSKTARGDEILNLATDGVVTGASPSFRDIPGGTQLYHRSGKTLRVVHRARLHEVSTTWDPTWADAGVQFVRSAPSTEGEPAVTEAIAPEVPAAPAPVINQTLDLTPLVEASSAQTALMQRSFDEFTNRITSLEERSRQEITIPGRVDEPQGKRGEWMQAVLRMLSGERVNDMQMRALDDLITSDNLGVVPPAYSKEIIGVIDPRRPFLQSTRRIPTPDSGMSLIMPKIVTRPTVATQTTEKSELDSTKTSITTQTFDAITKGGAGDISLQLLKRSSPSFLSLYLELLAEAYAVESEDEAVDQLLAASLTNGGALDPEDANFGAAWAAAASTTRRGPDTIWLSSSAVGAFINAKANGTNAPLYSDLRADFTAAGGVGGNISGLRPVWVPALDDEAVDVIIGPSSGFVWAEDGTYTLQVDVPAKAGRDVAIVGILWFAPIYPSAFTKYTVAS